MSLLQILANILASMFFLFIIAGVVFVLTEDSPKNETNMKENPAAYVSVVVLMWTLIIGIIDLVWLVIVAIWTY